MNLSMILLNYIIMMIPLFIILMMLYWNNPTPMTIMIKLIIFSLSIALNMAKFSSSTQLSFLLFLMMTSGVLILFTFFISLISNEWINSNPMFSIILVSIISIFSIYLINNPEMNFNFNLDYQNIENKMNLKQNFNIMQIYNKPFIHIIFMLLSYMMMNLFYITKICLNNNKPLQSNYN